MRQTHSTLTAADVRRHTDCLLQQFLPFTDYKRSLKAHQLRHLLLAMACWGIALLTALQRLQGFPCYDSVRKALHFNLPTQDQLLKALVAALQARLPRSFRKKRWDVALDLHGIPFYGDKHTQGLRGGQAKLGTKYFWTYGTLALVHKGRRWTIALQPVPATGVLVIVEALLTQLRQADLRVRTLLLDSGFYSAEVIAYLQQQRIPFVMPALRRGRLDGPKGPTGTARYFARTEDGLFEYRWRARGKAKGVEVCVRLAVVTYRRRLRAQERKKGKKAGAGGWVTEAWVFAYGNLEVERARSLVSRYRKRFGIESSYRQLRQGLARTSSKEARVRLLLVGLALLLRNVWVWLHWQRLSTARRGFRELHPERLTLENMLFWISEEVKGLYGVRLEVQTDRQQ